MFNINADTYAKSYVHSIEVIKKDNKIHNIQDKLGVKNMSDLTIKAIIGIYDTETLTIEQVRKYKGYGKELIKNLAGINIREDLTLAKIMDCRSPTAIGFRSKLGFNQTDLIMTKEQSVLIKVMKVFCSEEILLQHFVLNRKIDLYFPRHKLAIEVDEKGHKDRDKCKEIERKNSIKDILIVNLLELTLVKKKFDVYFQIDKIYNHINKLSKKSLIGRVFKRLSELGFRSNHSIT